MTLTGPTRPYTRRMRCQRRKLQEMLVPFYLYRFTFSHESLLSAEHMVVRLPREEVPSASCDLREHKLQSMVYPAKHPSFNLLARAFAVPSVYMG